MRIAGCMKCILLSQHRRPSAFHAPYSTATAILMHPLRNQRTLAARTSVSGFGYWSGRDVTLDFHPAEPDSGLVFVRYDVDPEVRIAATVANRIEVPRRTTLRHQGTDVEMVEHVLGALAGLHIDNCEIRVNAAEMPGMDGSAKAFVEALESVGVVDQAARRRRLVISEVTRLGNDEAWIEARPPVVPGLRAKYRLDYGSDNAIGRQTLQMWLTPETFRRELADSRTFMLKKEADWLIAQELGTRVTPRDLLVFDDLGPIDNELRYEDECVRHKMLDLVGDLALAGCDLVGQIVAHRSGHRLNAELARVLLAEGELIEERRRSA